MTPPRTSARQPDHEGPARTPRAGPSPSPHSRSQRDAKLLILDDGQHLPRAARLTITPRRATAGPPGSRAWRLNACTGSLTARGPLTARDNAASDVAFRPLGRRRHPEPMISRLNNPAYVSLCQRFACVLTGADA